MFHYHFPISAVSEKWYLLGCPEGTGISPGAPQWPCLAYFKWSNLCFAELQSSIAHKSLLDNFGTGFPKRYLDIRVCMCFESFSGEFQFAFPQSENILQTTNHLGGFWDVITQAAAYIALWKSCSKRLHWHNGSWFTWMWTCNKCILAASKPGKNNKTFTTPFEKFSSFLFFPATCHKDFKKHP